MTFKPTSVHKRTLTEGVLLSLGEIFSKKPNSEGHVDPDTLGDITERLDKLHKLYEQCKNEYEENQQEVQDLTPQAENCTGKLQALINTELRSLKGTGRSLTGCKDLIKDLIKRHMDQISQIRNGDMTVREDSKPKKSLADQ